jgi:DNA-binding IclR family transcriptional regulator
MARPGEARQYSEEEGTSDGRPRSNGNGRAPADSEASLAPAVTRAVAVLDALAAEPGVAAGTSELSRRLGLPKSSIANICAALVEAGLLRRAGAGFRLGRRLAELGGAYLSAVDQVQEFYDACESLETASEETMQLGILDGTEVTYIARHDGRQPIRLASEIGRRLPASCTAMGKAAMASLDGDELAERLRGIRWLPTMTAKSHRTVDSLMTDLEGVRERGYAIDDEETAEGVICYAIAVPPRRAGDNPYGASVTLLKARATDERRELLVGDLRRLSRMLTDPLHVAGSTG